MAAETDESTGTVRLDESVLNRALATVPSSFTLTPRNPAHAVTLGGDHLVFGLVAGRPTSMTACAAGDPATIATTASSSSWRSISTPCT